MVGTLGKILKTTDGVNYTDYSGVTGRSNLPADFNIYAIAGSGSSYVVWGLQRDPTGEKHWVQTWTNTGWDWSFQSIATVSKVWRSTNLTSWTEVTPSGAQGRLPRLWNAAYLGGAYYLVGRDSNQIAIFRSADDGLTWTNVCPPPVYGTSSSTFAMDAIAYSGSLYVAVGDSALATSSDGVNWTLNSSPYLWYSVVWTGSQFVATRVIITALSVGSQTANTVYDYYYQVVTSTDGVNWTIVHPV